MKRLKLDLQIGTTAWQYVALVCTPSLPSRFFLIPLDENIQIECISWSCFCLRSSKTVMHSFKSMEKQAPRQVRHHLSFLGCFSPLLLCLLPFLMREIHTSLSRNKVTKFYSSTFSVKRHLRWTFLSMFLKTKGISTSVLICLLSNSFGINCSFQE